MELAQIRGKPRNRYFIGPLDMNGPEILLGGYCHAELCLGVFVDLVGNAHRRREIRVSYLQDNACQGVEVAFEFALNKSSICNAPACCNTL